MYAALKTLQLPARLDRFIDIAIQVGVWIQIGLWAAQAARFTIDRRMHQVGGERLPTLAVLRFVSLVLIWALALLLLLSNLGVNVTALATSLGIGGVAVALAVQNVLGDVLASLAIAFDKPYVIGDELHLDDIVGTVEHIGIKSTRLRSIDGEQIIIANSQMLAAKLKNLGRAPEQRIAMVLTLAFDSSQPTLAQFPGLIREVVESLAHARLHRCNLRGLGAAGFEFDVSFYATAPGQVSSLQLREQFVLTLLSYLERRGIGFTSAAPVLGAKPPPAAALGALTGQTPAPSRSPSATGVPA